MANRRWPAILGAAAFSVGGWFVPSLADAGKHFHLRAKAPSQCGIPAHNFGSSIERSSARIVAIASVDQPEAINQYQLGLDGRKTAPVQRKNFFVPRPSIQLNDIRLDRMGFALYDTGQFACTGRLAFGGGPEAALRGANVIVRVRAYSGVPQHPGSLGNMRLLWETERKFWVSRNWPLTSSLLPDVLACPCDKRQKPVSVYSQDVSPRAPSTLILQHFDEITHLEIVLEHLRDR